ncbi:MAG: S1 RNA-binding domain-containing protein [Chlorobiota bacterium]
MEQTPVPTATPEDPIGAPEGGGEPSTTGVQPSGFTAKSVTSVVPPLPSEKIAEVERLVADRSILEVTVTERIRGGFRAQYDDLTAFLPTALATSQRHPTESELRELVGQRVHVVAHELRRHDDGTATFVVSRRHFLEDLALARLKVGDIIEGKATRLVATGVFVEVGGIEGFIPLAELDHIPVPTPSKVLSPGELVRVQVIEVDVNKRRVRLSRKALLPSPWEGVETRYPVGSRVRGIVRRVLPRAAVVQIEPGIDGIVPVEELSWTHRVAHPAYVFSAGQEVELVVVESSATQKRLVLSLRRTQPDPWEGAVQRYPVGSRVRATVRRLSATAAFVELEDGLLALIPAAELSWSRPRPSPSSLFHIGQEVEAAVLQVEPRRQLIVLSYRQAQPSPWESAEERFPVGSRVHGIVRRVLPKGAIIEVGEGLEGFIPLSELSWLRRPNHAAEVLQAGQEVEGVVLEVSAAEQRLVLSLRRAQPNPWPELAQRYAIGTECEVTFVRQERAGALVRLPEGVDAFMPRSTFAHLLRKTREPWKPGDTLRVRIVELNPEELSLIVEPILAKPAPPPAVRQPSAASLSRPAPPRPAAQRPPKPKPTGTSPPSTTREERRTGVTLAELLSEEVRQKLLRGAQSEQQRS